MRSSTACKSVGVDDDSLEIPRDESAWVNRGGIEGKSPSRGSRRGFLDEGPALNSSRGRFRMEAFAATNEGPTKS